MARDYGSSIGDDESIEQEDIAYQAETRGRPAERFVFVAAAGLSVAGLALILLPTIVPQFGWVVNSLARRGVTSLPLLVGGVILYGTWLSTRSSRAHTETIRESAPDPAPKLEKLTGEVAHLGDGLQSLRIEFVYLKDALHAQQERSQSNASSEISADGMFRLAASLDQVGYRIEERVHANHQEIGQALQGLTSAIEALRTLTLNPRLQNGADGEGRGNGPRRGELESESSSSSGRDPRLGLLDMLDDLGRLLPRKTSPALERPDVEMDSFEGARDEGWKQAGVLPGPLPSSPRNVDLNVIGPGPLLSLPRSSGAEAPLGDKLTELRSLLADQRVRDALSSIERNRS